MTHGGEAGGSGISGAEDGGGDREEGVNHRAGEHERVKVQGDLRGQGERGDQPHGRAAAGAGARAPDRGLKIYDGEVAAPAGGLEEAGCEAGARAGPPLRGSAAPGHPLKKREKAPPPPQKHFK